jgi:hypothetical protein
MKGNNMKTKTIFEIFPGISVFDTEPVEVQNPFSGDTIMLTPEEVAVYDYCRGSEMTGNYKGVRKALSWFAKNNPTAYMVLLD